MNKDNFSKIINQIDLISDDDAEQLDDVVRRYPYFSLGHTLIAKHLHQKNSHLADQKIRKAALYSSSRTVLYQILDPVQSNPKSSDPKDLNEAKSFLDSVKKEMEAFGQKMENATEEELDKELNTIATSYVPIQDQSLVADASNELPSLDDIDMPYTSQNLEQEETQPNEEVTQTDDIFRPTEKEVNSHAEELTSSNFFGENPVPSTQAQSFSNFFEQATDQIIPRHNSTNEQDDPFPSLFELPTVTEGEAQALLNEGNKEAATMLYGQLIRQEPQHRQYYISQMEAVGLDTSFLQEDTPQSQNLFETPVDDPNNTEFEPSVLDDNIDQNMPADEQEPSITEFDAINLYQNGDNAGALQVFQKLMQLYPDRVDYFQNQINILELEDNNTASQDTIPTTPNKSASEMDAISLYQNGNNVEALRVYQKLIQQNPERADYFENQIKILELDKYQVETNNAPSDIKMVSEMDAITHYQQGEMQEAYDTYQKLMLQYPDKEEYYQNQIKILDLEEFAQTSVLDNPSVEPSTIEPSPKDDPTSFIEDQQLVQDDQELTEVDALDYYHQGDTKAALEVYQRLMIQRPDKKEYYQNQIDILELDDGQEIANASSDQSVLPIEKEKNNMDSYDLNLSESDALGYYYNGEKEKALETYLLLIDKEPEKKEYYLNQIEKFDLNPQKEITDTSASDIPAQDDTLSEEVGQPKSSFPQVLIQSNEQNRSEEVSEEEEPILENDNVFGLPSSDEEDQNIKREEARIEDQDIVVQKSEEDNDKELWGVVENRVDSEDEFEAIKLLNEGRTEEAKEVYQSLIAQNPDKAMYYTAQMEIMGLKELEESKPKKKKKKKKEEEPINPSDITEERAMQLYLEGRKDEAIEIYKQLSLHNPDKKAYFDDQIKILQD